MINFWNYEKFNDKKNYLIDDSDLKFQYPIFSEKIQEIITKIEEIKSRRVGILVCSNSLSWLAAYLSILNKGLVPLLVPTDYPEKALNSLLKKFKASWVWDARNIEHIDNANFVSKVVDGFETFHENFEFFVSNDDLALMMGTSGSTGSPKFVKISYDSLQSNANSICEYLNLQNSDSTITTLPSSYSYGLSLINTHLNASGSIVISNLSPITRGFYELIDAHSISNISGVPTLYELYKRTGFLKKQFKSLKFLTQAGGHLHEDLKYEFLKYTQFNDMDFYIMYGQTEATARMSYVPPKMLENNINSIGIPIPGGAFDLNPENSELIYRGKNVMMGYAECFDDLQKKDQMNGELKTGDIARIGSNGLFYITGRIKRIIKLNGTRVSLDEIEKEISSETKLSIFAIGNDGILKIIIYKNAEFSDESLNKVKSYLSKKLRLLKKQYEINIIDIIPFLDNGKVDYGTLKSLYGIK